MKVILSRKGFDSGYGGYPSPILPDDRDDRLVSLPIPSEDNIYYSKLRIDSSLTYYDVMSGLKSTIRVKNNNEIQKRKWEALKENTTCHLDPDIYRNAIERPKDWKPIFGQVDAAQTHLKNKGVKEGDIFLFFGTFRKTEDKGECLTFIRGEPEIHIIFGYLQIGEVMRIRSDTQYPHWMNYHPHIDSVRLRKKKNNTIYIARDTLSWNSMLPGAAPFNFHEDLVLTKKGKYSRSRWNLDAIKKVKISYNKNSWKDNYFQSAPIGQEFVIEDNPTVVKWVKKLISPTED